MLIRRPSLDTMGEYPGNGTVVAQPPKAAFVTGLRSRRLPDKTACQLPDQTDNCLGGSFLHWCYAPSGHTEISVLVTGVNLTFVTTQNQTLLACR